jgi:hypothetical protein
MQEVLRLRLLNSSTPRRPCFIHDSYKVFSLLPQIYFHDIHNFTLFLHFYFLNTTTSRLLYAPFTYFFVSSLALKPRTPSKPQRLVPSQDHKGNITPVATVSLEALG